ncbi:hypothetical protein SAMN05421827_11914 [Pedobacter terrae]|uniref:Uncharacterized protein n=1 Tax=Pedobacter terrae TaxID=405671 RepID=A0A1G8AI04_9SPHI|nr:hypothetical protein [Pedobacter terrae]SDH20519.1 hypothetical protein SAMN05421827_11914 [Pedobacter terrae]
MIIDFSNIWQILKQGIAGIAEKKLREYAVAATSDGYKMVNEMQTDLKSWINELTSGSISKSDFADLVAGQKDELKMELLEQAGLSEILVDQFKQDICDLITNTVLASIP